MDRNKNLRQLRLNVEQIVFEYGNGQSDWGTEDYPSLTPDQWFDYVTEQLYDMLVVNQGSCFYGNGICDHLKFLGNDVIREVIVEIATGEGLVA